jgi:hypothetical protein
MRRADPEKMYFRGGKDNGCGEKMLILVGTVLIENRVPVTRTKLEMHDAETRLHDSEKQGQGQGQPVTHFVRLRRWHQLKELHDLGAVDAAEVIVRMRECK